MRRAPAPQCSDQRTIVELQARPTSPSCSAEEAKHLVRYVGFAKCTGRV